MKRITKSRNKVVDGVLGGLAEYIGIDPVWLRIGYILFAIFGDAGTAFIIYLVGMFIMPKGDGIINASESDRFDEMKRQLASSRFIYLLGFVLILIGVVFLIEQIYDLNIWRQIDFFFYQIRKYLWPVLLILLGFWVVFRAKR